MRSRESLATAASTAAINSGSGGSGIYSLAPAWIAATAARASEEMPQATIEVAGIVGDGGQHRGDQFWIRRQRDIFLGAGMDRGNRGAGVRGDAAGDDRNMDVLGLEPHHEVADVEPDIDQEEVCALAAAQHRQGLLVALGMGDGGAIVHRDLGGCGELALQGANDEKPHVSLLFS